MRLVADIAEMESMIARTLNYVRECRDAETLRPATIASDAANQRGTTWPMTGKGERCCRFGALSRSARCQTLLITRGVMAVPQCACTFVTTGRCSPSRWRTSA